MKNVKYWLFITIIFVAITACNQQDSSSKEATKEILLQLGEIQEKLAALKTELKATNTKIDNMIVAGGGKKPAPVVHSVSLKNKPAEGVKVAVIEFTDYQCPYCARHAKKTLPLLRSNYVDKGLVHYEIRHFPLDFHPKAKGASIAVNCVPMDKHDSMHDWVFNNPNKMNNSAYIIQAKALGVNVETYTTCLNNSEIAKAIDADIKYGKKIGVNVTPSFFIGTIKDNKIIDVTAVSGAAHYNRFESEIKKRL